MIEGDANGGDNTQNPTCLLQPSPMGLTCVTLQMSVLSAELSAERRDGNVGNYSAHCISSCARGRTPCLATQQGVGILSKRWQGTGPSDRGRAPVDGAYLTGMMA